MPRCRVPFESTMGVTRLLFSIVLTCFGFPSSAQQGNYPVLTNADSADIWFDQIASPVNAAIVNGPEYRIPVMGTQSHPFFRSQESDRTYIHYDNDLYRNVDLLYDAFGDVLVYKFISPDKVLFIKLDSRMVQDFSLHQHYFKKYNEGIRAGIGAYFDVLFEKDDFAVVVKRRKVERLEGKLSVYIEDDVHYILNNGQWIRITGNGSFSKTLPKDQRKELTTFLKGNHINVRKRKDDDLKKVGAFCYSLKERK